MKENDKTSHRAELMRDIVAMVNQNPVLKQAWQRKKEKSIQNTEFEYPEHLSVEHIDMGLFKMEYLTWNGFTPRSAVERQCFPSITGWHQSTHFRRH